MITQINVMRVFAAFCIIAIHVTSGQLLKNSFAYFINQSGRFASPLFVIIAGMVLTYIELKRPSPTIVYFYKKRFMRVLLPYIAWSLIYMLYSARHDLYGFQWGHLFTLLTEAFPQHLLKGSAFVHLYFILIMVQLYALFPLLYRWLRKEPRSFLLCSFLLSAGLNSLVYFHQLGWLQLPLLPIPYVALSINWLFYFALGMAVMNNEAQWMRRMEGVAAKVLVAAGWGIALTWLLIDGKATGTYGISVKPSSFVYSLLTFCLLYMVVYFSAPSKAVMHRSGWQKAMNWLAKHSFLIYLVHPLCLNVLLRISVNTGNASVFYGTDGLLLLYVLTIAMTLAGIFFIQLLPFSFLLGGHRRMVSQSRAVQPNTGSFKG